MNFYLYQYVLKYMKSFIQIFECICVIWLYNYCIYVIEKFFFILFKVLGGLGDGYLSVNNLNVLEKRNGSNLFVLFDFYFVVLQLVVYFFFF